MLAALLSASLLPAAALVAASPAVQPRPRSVVTRGEGYLHATVHAVEGLPSLRRRAAQGETLVNKRSGTSYVIDIEIGTPGQTVTLILDTGSPDLWVNPTCATANDAAECNRYPDFDYTKSTSLKETDYVDILRYGKGNATIVYVTDTVTIGSSKITSQIFGVNVESYDIPMGILGLSPPINPNSADNYPFVLDSLAAQGIIKSRAFSLDLRAVSSPTGAIIFGGIDTSKFAGSLARLPMLSPSQTPLGADRYWITLTGIGLTFPDGTSDTSGVIEVPVFPDSGGTLSRLPTPIFQAFGESFPTAQYDPESGFYIVDCAVANVAGSVDFYFGSKQIAVPYADFIWQPSRGDCVLGVLPDDEEPVLGDSFLRAAYVVHDQDNRALHIAQAAECGTKQNIVSIGSGKGAVPNVTGDCAEAPRATRTGSGLDATNTREPGNIFTGNGPKIDSLGGPGPAGGRTPTSGGLGPSGKAKSGAGRAGTGRGWGALGAVVVGGLLLV
ncbi:putative eukaryotic aspartyl protease [Podospora conica]|nr:putative eukaryotic aspartyl protease [Schizothecium conicum]